ncbi:MAG: hypothetical protein A2X70_04065 [Alphaproteobacteria bacterium GWC2_42_16]|nr:MAG: hypothetical protein A2X70_04065 [Alphaproteobacteria bacterium GWC2_42_16]OFW83223.1 MAG: hypothetical protein A3E50_00975 [Alphaproteobacteria bacterium RIFCSPHIGHO2_12_FULL_42_100]OFW86008.1 MAG: hypothetical protein A2W06_06800 [Alphaproteobacteria bacterium RBG_16_42_14]OFW92049.1 MAG: hypothetical protein A3C41_01540 [Alphaproteobacteria bacterium RIFCSPHIGHO2_02_FULL_42_30]HBG35036.1 hypothetical protein [Holosporales bacterium]
MDLIKKTSKARGFGSLKNRSQIGFVFYGLVFNYSNGCIYLLNELGRLNNEKKLFSPNLLCA